MNKKNKEYMTFQEQKIFKDCLKDLMAWGEKSQNFESITTYQEMLSLWNQTKLHPRDYQKIPRHSPQKFIAQEINNIAGKIMGKCPVDSDKTRCCELLTLDVIRGCNVGCTYCSIKYFYHQKDIPTVTIPTTIKDDLCKLEFDTSKTYHIGTGQSSDSLLINDHPRLIKELYDFADENPNIILEFKSKLSAIDNFLCVPIPKNVIFTWTISPPSLVSHEEPFSASLEDRILAAKKVVKHNRLVGFHLHPIVPFKDYLLEYQKIAEIILATFNPKDVICLSLGTLTFIKKLIPKIREGHPHSQILKMPFAQLANKLTYPLKDKEVFFSQIYELFSPWHKDIFFYFCMEDPALWTKVFGYEYASNLDFSNALRSSYFKKINSL